MSPIADHRRRRGRQSWSCSVRTMKDRSSKALHGLTRTLVSNMVTGVTEGYTKTLEIVGTGYQRDGQGSGSGVRAGLQPLDHGEGPRGHHVRGREPDPASRSAGIDKQLVGETAAKIRKLRKPEPYKGKGVRYENEVIRRKAGKAGK